MATKNIKPTVAASAAELSGEQWVKKFAASADLKDLAPSFRKSVEAFVDAMMAADVRVRISSTYRSPERSYLMHWCWKIRHKQVKAEDVPAMAGVDINWVHPTDVESIAAARKMTEAFDMAGLNTEPALHSLHNEGRAIDMTISWMGSVTIRNADGKAVLIKTAPRTGMNRQLKSIGASYGVKKFVGGAKDKPHWSATGR